MREKVLHYIRERRLVRAGDRVCAAVSAGADSVALLRVLLELRTELGIVLSVAHFNHGLRGEESKADEAFVAELAREHGLEYFPGCADVRAYAKREKASIEAAARDLRYRWLTLLAVEQKLDEVATAHTLDDQAETVLLKFLRGAGTRGLAAIYPTISGNESRMRFVRPLLSVSRSEVEAYLSALGQVWREDETNLERRFLRNRVRHDLLPLLERDFNPKIRLGLSDAAELARAEEDYWMSRVEEELQFRLTTPEPKSPTEKLSDISQGRQARPASPMELDLQGFASLPLALQRRVLKAFVENAGMAADFEHVQATLRCALGEVRRAELRHGWFVRSDGERLQLCEPGRSASAIPGAYEYVLCVPGTVRIAETGVVLRASVLAQETAVGCAARDGLLSAELESVPLTVRNWRPGDRFWPVHTKSEEKLKRLFSQRHIPAEQRGAWPVVLMGEQIVWVRGFPVARAHAWDGNGNPVSIDVVELGE